MKRTFKLFNITLFCLVILIGAILDVYSYTMSVSIDADVSETTRLIEDFSDSIFPLHIIDAAPSMFFLELLSTVTLSEPYFQFASTIPQLLCSNRIALPPPLIS